MNFIPFEINKVYSFYDDGKISLSRMSKMKIVKFVNGLYSALRFKWNVDGKIISIWDMWKESLKEDINSFDSIAHKIYDWGCEDFIICHPIGERVVKNMMKMWFLHEWIMADGTRLVNRGMVNFPQRICIYKR